MISITEKNNKIYIVQDSGENEKSSGSGILLVLFFTLVVRLVLLDNPDLKLKDIKFTKAKRPRTGQARPYCDNCVNIFGVTN